jgi:ATP-dependent Clp protease ATP-binding subunit ClpX
MTNIINGNFPQSEQKEPIICSMCGQKEADGVPIISNQSFHICGNCVRDSYTLLKDEPMKLDGDFRKKTPSKIVEFVNQYVIGQDNAKQTLALAIYNHYKRMSNPIYNDVELQKSNILLIGPSGTCKTFLIQSIARFLDIPFTIADATSMSSTGFVGSDAESMLHALIQNANGDIEKAQRGIIFVDEIDKTAKKSMGASSDKDPAGEGLQQALLKMIEGTVCTVPKTGGRKVQGNMMDTIDTTNILFICGGAFVDLEPILQKNHATKSNSIGFGAKVDKDDKQQYQPEPEYLYEFGMIPELIGRLPIICTLDELDVSSLERILVEPKNSVTKQFQALCSMDGAKLEFSDAAITKIAEMSFERKTGARGLRSILESVLNKYMFALPDQENVSKLLVDVINDEIVVTTDFLND